MLTAEIGRARNSRMCNNLVRSPGYKKHAEHSLATPTHDLQQPLYMWACCDAARRYNRNLLMLLTGLPGSARRLNDQKRVTYATSREHETGKDEQDDRERQDPVATADSHQ